MAQGKATLKDVARALGVTTTTVHRALHGKEGVSGETRQRVQQAAAEMGYRSNYMAATLKRGRLRIAVALPEPTGDNRFYYGNLWQGVRRYFAEVAEFNLEVLEYSYPFTHGASGAVLKQIYERLDEGLDGLLTIAAEEGQSAYFIEKLAEKHVPIVFIGSDMHKDKRFCCVKTHDGMAGSLAAELLTGFCGGAPPKRVVLVGHFGQLALGDQLHNMNGFEQYAKAHAPEMELLPVRGEDGAAVCAGVEKLLREGPPVDAIYSSSARHTVYAGELLLRLGLAGKVKLIGNDRFAESLDLLRRGAVSALVDKKTDRQSYLAAKILTEYLVKGEYPHSSVVHVQPEVVLQSNVCME